MASLSLTNRTDFRSQSAQLVQMAREGEPLAPANSPSTNAPSVLRLLRQAGRHSGLNRSRSTLRARASRDLTVPTATPSDVAISS